MNLERVIEYVILISSFYAIGGLGLMAFKRLRNKHRQFKLIKLLIKKGGKASIHDIALSLNIRIEKAEVFIEKMQDRGVLIPVATKEGNVIVKLNNYDYELSIAE